MRLLTRKIHRAFPELDSYDDEQCHRFIKSARSNPWVMLLHTAAILAATIPVLVLGMIGAVWLSDKLRIFDFVGSTDILSLRLLVWLPTGGAMMAAGPIVGYIVRDALLRRRVRYVLRTRGGCPGCGYSVIGLAVTQREDGGTIVRCPECGVDVEVDPSLAELVKENGTPVGGGAGSARPAVAVGATGRVFVGGQKVDLSVFWTARRKRVLKRVSLTLLVVVVGGSVLVLSVNEVLTRSTAAAARRDLAETRAKLRALAASMREGGSVGGGEVVQAAAGLSIWDHLARAKTLMEELDQTVWRDRVGGSGGANVYPEFAFIDRPELMELDPSSVYFSNQTAEQNRASEALARRMIEVYREGGVFDAIASAAASRAMSAPDDEFDRSPPDYPGMDRITSVRMVIRMLRGRMAVAAQRNDQAEFLASMEGMLAVARACAAYPRAYEQILAASSENACADGIRRWLLQPQGRADLSWLPDVSSRLEHGRPTLRFDLALEGDALWAGASVQAFFAEPANFRWGRLSPPFRARAITQQGWTAMPSALRHTRLGTYRENMRELTRFYEVFIPAIEGEGPSRQAMMGMTPPKDMGLLRGIAGAPYYLGLIDDTLATRRGTDLWLAIERYRLARGGYPERLADLVPEWAAAIPADPWSGAAPIYRRLDPHDVVGRGFVLYFVGKDLIDDSGVGAPSTVLGTPGLGRDFVVNDPWR